MKSFKMVVFVFSVSLASLVTSAPLLPDHVRRRKTIIFKLYFFTNIPYYTPSLSLNSRKSTSVFCVCNISVIPPSTPCLDLLLFQNIINVKTIIIINVMDMAGVPVHPHLPLLVLHLLETLPHHQQHLSTVIRVAGQSCRGETISSFSPFNSFAMRPVGL